MVLGGDFNVSIDKGQGGELEEVTKVFGLQDAFRAAGMGVLVIRGGIAGRRLRA